ncbi:MAG: BREX system ATP-binding protein BrxD, partial [Planctomycetota bacterium]
HVDFKTEARFDNPRAVQIRLPAFNLERLWQVGCRVRNIFQQQAHSPERIAAHCDNDYVRVLAEAVAGKLGGKVGVAPRIFLKKLVAEVLDRVDQFPDFDPRQNYALTIADTELTAIERQAMSAASVDDIEIDV